MKKILSLLTLMLITTCLFAQNITLTGKVKDKNGEILIGAVILEKGTTNGTITDVDGNYKITIPADAVVECSMLGFRTEQIKISEGMTKLDFILQDDTKDLEEVVVIGYGTAKKSDLTSSISSVSAEDVTSFNSGNAMNALQSKVNGVQISNTGMPGASPNVIIRGVTTVNGSNPLYVVDGMPVGDNINFLNPEDIESMEVLKDASASAIYGTRASNGVIIITTKKGKVGKTTFQFSSSLGLSVIKDPGMAKASEYEKVYKTRYENDKAADYRWDGIVNITDEEGTDWWNEAVNKYAMTQNYNLSFQGGTEKLIYSGSFGYYRSHSHFNYGYWEKFTGRINTEYSFNDHVKLGVEFSPKLERWDDTPENIMRRAMNMDPTTPIFRYDWKTIDNEYSWYARSNNNQEHNPVADLKRQNAHSDEYGLLMNPYLNIEIIKGLTFKTQFGDNARFRLHNNFEPKYYIHDLEQNEKNKVSRKSEIWNDWNWTNTLNYQKIFAERHSLNLMAGYTMEKFSYYWLSGSRDATPSNNENLRYITAGTENFQTDGCDDFSTLVSYLGRLMYNFDSRYYLTASLRFDGSSKFPKGNKFATFPAISAAWRISGEEFMKSQKIFTNLKLRLGWGKVGNQNIPNDSYETSLSTIYYVDNGELKTGTIVSSTANLNIQWETVEDYNIGLDMGFLKDRLTATIDVFKKQNHEMLLQEEQSSSFGLPSTKVWKNVGSMEATGLEISLNWKDQIKKNVGYEIGVNLSAIKNIGKDFGTSSPIHGSHIDDFGDDVNRSETGEELSRFWGYKTAGIFQNWTEITSYANEYGDLYQPKAKPGDLIFVDNNKDGILDENDKTYIGNAFPKFTMGINLAANYKNWDFSMNFYGTFGNEIFNYMKRLYSGKGDANVWEGTYEAAWHYEGQDTDIPRLSAADENGNYKKNSDWFVENGSYLRCKQMQIGYTIPEDILKFGSLRISLSAQNLFTITKYSGLDPETVMTRSVTEKGVDYFSYPNTKIFLFGVNLNF
ncbi:MAG: TonB-dependent receptor [Bacteroidales bacterium]|nr:TonB-dependent receptor [Bacteroidales bacterium]